MHGIFLEEKRNKNKINVTLCIWADNESFHSHLLLERFFLLLFFGQRMRFKATTAVFIGFCQASQRSKQKESET